MANAREASAATPDLILVVCAAGGRRRRRPPRGHRTARAHLTGDRTRLPYAWAGSGPAAAPSRGRGGSARASAASGPKACNGHACGGHGHAGARVLREPRATAVGHRDTHLRCGDLWCDLCSRVSRDSVRCCAPSAGAWCAPCAGHRVQEV